MSPLQFSKRASTAVIVFACLGIASPQGAPALLNSNGTVVASPVQLGQMWLQYAQLVGIYQQLLHQDVANQQTVLYALVAKAVVIVGNLNATLQAMTATGDAAFVLAGMSEVVANGTATPNNVTLVEQ